MTKTEALQLLADKISVCTKCQELTEFRTQNNGLTVPGEGNPNSKIVFSGEAPGKDESQTGKPFIGKAGKLLSSMLNYYGFNREDVFILNTIKCRPPNNRVPSDKEISNCKPYLDLQLKVINPQILVCLGKTAVKSILNKDEPFTQLRGKLHFYGNIKTICTFHPSYLLRNPSAKTESAKDFEFILKELK